MKLKLMCAGMAMAMAGSAFAQLRVYDSTGAARGLYLGNSKVWIADGTSKLEAHVSQVPADGAYSTFFYESTNCTGERLTFYYSWQWPLTQALTSQYGWAVYGTGAPKDVLVNSYQDVLGVGLSSCNIYYNSGYIYPMQKARLFQWAKPPLVVK
jgi:hypothetical protein